jgi:glycosyltransferase involved in cell wall biosynthesis
MHITIVLPCFNEIRHGYIQQILPNLINQKGDKEIIAVVSSSQDDTETFIAQYPQVKILHSTAQNRAQRLNEGIKASTGEIVLLHHPATLLPEFEALQMIADAFARSNRIWGGFQHSFDLEHWLLQFTSWYANQVRCKRKGIFYLDHCIFAPKQMLEAIAYVPDMDIFEDTVLSGRLCTFGSPVLVDGTVITSARRFRERGVYRQALLNQMLKIFYHLDIDPKYMNKIYEQKVSINVEYKGQDEP